MGKRPLKSSTFHLKKLFGSHSSNSCDVLTLQITDISANLEGKKLLYSAGFVSFSLCFAKINSMVSVGIFIHIDSFSVNGDSLAQIVHQPFIKNLMSRKEDDGQKEDFKIESKINEIMQIFGLIYPQIFVKFSNISGFQQLNALNNLEHVDPTCTVSCSFEALSLAIHSPIKPCNKIRLEIQIDAAFLDILKIPNSLKDYCQLISCKSFLLSADLEIEAMNINSITDLSQIYLKSNIMLDITSPEILIDECLLNFMRDIFSLNKSKMNSGELFNAPVESIQHKAIKNLNLLAKLLSMNLTFRITNLLLGLRFENVRTLNLNDSIEPVIYLSVTRFKKQVVLHKMHQPAVTDNSSLNSSLLLVDASANLISVGYSLVRSTNRFIIMEEDEDKLLTAREPVFNLQLKPNELDLLCNMKFTSINLNMYPLVRQATTDSFSMLVKLSSFVSGTNNDRTEKHYAKGIYHSTSAASNLIQIEVGLFKFSLISESSPHHCVETVVKNFVLKNNGGNINCLSKQVMISAISEWLHTVNSKKTEMLDVYNIYILKTDDALKIETQNMCLKLSITKIYIFLISVLFTMKIVKLFTPFEKSPIKKKSEQIQISIPIIEMQLKLPEDVNLQINLKRLALSGIVSEELNGTLENLSFDSYVPELNTLAENKKELTRFMVVDHTEFRLLDKNPAEIFLDAKKLKCIAKGSDPFYYVFENLILLNKAV